MAIDAASVRDLVNEIHGLPFMLGVTMFLVIFSFSALVGWIILLAIYPKIVSDDPKADHHHSLDRVEGRMQGACPTLQKRGAPSPCYVYVVIVAAVVIALAFGCLGIWLIMVAIAGNRDADLGGSSIARFVHWMQPTTTFFNQSHLL